MSHYIDIHIHIDIHTNNVTLHTNDGTIQYNTHTQMMAQSLTIHIHKYVKIPYNTHTQMIHIS